jgi:hypothetical protein
MSEAGRTRSRDRACPRRRLREQLGPAISSTADTASSLKPTTTDHTLELESRGQWTRAVAGRPRAAAARARLNRAAGLPLPAACWPIHRQAVWSPGRNRGGMGRDGVPTSRPVVRGASAAVQPERRMPFHGRRNGACHICASACEPVHARIPDVHRLDVCRCSCSAASSSPSTRRQHGAVADDLRRTSGALLMMTPGSWPASGPGWPIPAHSCMLGRPGLRS